MLLSFLLQLIAIAMLALAMHKHFKAVFNLNITPLQVKLLTLLGWPLLCLSYYLAIFSLAAPIATVYWLGLLSLSILFVALVTN
ncbi:DUF3325 domain-containing protein [uncultured Shewanella sp.]|uniref:DUF3325 domain-containing protein n=1 Tax=uncultured Shewanella sp. TaxID=173975 RepID=UPI002618B69E|nr:DUF3325 domain-containing protein [uncultured Shewanella sp.]